MHSNAHMSMRASGLQTHAAAMAATAWMKGPAANCAKTCCRLRAERVHLVYGVKKGREALFICAAPKPHVSHLDAAQHQRLQRGACPDRTQSRGPHATSVSKALQLQALEAGRQPPFAGLVHPAV
jgi:hypothetical protein